VAHTRCNREKRGRTPFEAFSGDLQRWEEILNRVRAWKDPGKLRAFECRAEDLDLDREDSFASRRLNETRYSTTQAAKYLGLLYGGRDADRGDGTRRRVIFATSGMATAVLRRGWELEAILRQPEPSANGKSRGKPRHDHRHHAIDAVVIALTSNATIQQLAVAAAAAAAETGSDRVSSRTLRAPWPNFADEVRQVIEPLLISHRPRHGLQGQLHDETNYSKPHGEFVHVRKPVHTITEKQIDKIVDPAVRQAVRAKIEAVGDPKKLEHDRPMLRTRAGRDVPINKVRLRAKPAASVRPIGSGAVDDTAKHHIALFAGRDKKGRDRWLGEVVSRFEAMQRKAQCHCPQGHRCECVVRRTAEKDPQAEFLFSLMGGDTVEMARVPGADVVDLYVVRTISESSKGVIELDFVRHNQAAEIKDLKKAGEWDRVQGINELLGRACRKVAVDALGRIRPAAG
jgi:CRISPR-associated endonuclease Csn1